MAKNSIGQFIAALRRANGMTQQEVADRLNVSNKAVSRWERDECAPDLSVIPALAEMFGITCDELLRGERNNPDRDADVETTSKQKAKSDKQFRLMLDRRNRKYKNLTLISIGITIFGFIAALIANAGFSKGLIAFCLATAFCVASEICQICFAINARITPDEDDDTYTDRIKEANTSVIKTAVVITFINVLLVAFCLPLVTMINGVNNGLVFEYWLGYGFIYSVIAFAVGYILYALFVRKVLADKGIITLAEKRAEEIKKNNKLLIKVVSISTAIALVLGVCIVVWNIVGWDVFRIEYTFDNCAVFKAFMENEYETWYNEGYSYVDENGDVVVNLPIAPDSDINVLPDDEKNGEDYYPKKVYKEIKNSKGEVICEYYYNPDLYKDISFTESSNDKMPVTVITNQAYYDGRNAFQTVESILYTLIVIDFIVAAGIYLIKIKKDKKTV